jgi:hypothetical protein
VCSETLIRRFAGVFVLVTVSLGLWVHPAWFAGTAFVGANLLQSSFTNLCPLERVLGFLQWFGCRPRQTAR